MKKFSLISCLILIGYASIAQQTPSNTLPLNNFVGNATIKILPGDKAEITANNSTVEINTVQKNGVVRLKDRKDLERIQSEFRFPKAVINEQLAQIKDVNEVEKLLTKASTSENKSLYIVQGDTTGMSTPLVEEEEFTTHPNTENANPEETSTNWMLLIGAAFIAFVCGIFFGRVSKSSKNAASEVEFEDAMDLEPTTNAINEQTAPAPKTKSKLDVHQLKAKYDKLYSDSKILKKAYGDLKKEKMQLEQWDKAYYQAAFQDIVLPLQQAIDNGKLDEVYKYLTIAAIQYTAVTRAKLTKKQKYDETNIAILLKQPSAQTYPELSKQTAVDKTPANLRPIISILTQLGVKNLNNFIFQGYKITDL